MLGGLKTFLIFAPSFNLTGLNVRRMCNVGSWPKLRFRIFSTFSCQCKKQPVNLKGKKVVAQSWLTRHLNDPYVRLAKDKNWRCRSAFKLLEIDEKYKLFHEGFVAIDCGAAPGSWTQVTVDRVNALSKDADKPRGKVIGIDLQPMIPIPGAVLLEQSDFTAKSTQERILTLLNGQKVDIVLSDMAPNATGIKSMDQENIVELCKIVLIFSLPVLKSGGTILCKIWQGSDQQELQTLLKRFFKRVNVVKPPASRSHSAEVFLLAREFLELSPKRE